MRTKKIVAKRFKITKTGKVMRRKQMAGHLKYHKSKSQRRRFNVKAEVKGRLAKTIRNFIPYQ